MKFGLKESFRGMEVPRGGFNRLYREHLELAVEAERLGYDNVWLNEHHFVGDGYSPSVLPLAAAVAVRTERIRIGTSLLLMPLHHPINVAEDAAVVDVLSNGRLDLGMGQGYKPDEFVSYNVPAAQRGRRLREGVEIVRRLLAGERVTFAGKYFSVTDALLDPPVVQQPHPPLWLGGRSRTIIEWAARHGYHLIGAGGLGVFGDQRPSEVYKSVLRESGRNPDEFCIGQVRYGYVAATRERAWAEASRAAHYSLSTLGAWLADAADLPGDEGFRKVPPPNEMQQVFGAANNTTLLIGSPDDIVSSLEHWLATDPFTHLVLEMSLPGIETAKVRESMRLFANEVMPHFRG
jgi:alkanesulfonate monooxygenase SsuD/methylene tetrahydromethanopterin reductase-like flavin-dependent oxidoreductase (luciferase family)